MVSEQVKRVGTPPLYLQAWLCGRHGVPGCRAALAVQTAAPHALSAAPCTGTDAEQLSRALLP